MGTYTKINPTRAERRATRRAARDWRDAHPADVPPRVTTPEPRRTASIEAWRTSPAVVHEYNRGFRCGFIAAMAFYGLLSTVLVLAFHVLGFRP